MLPPLQTLDGFGILAPPPPTAQPIPAAKAHDLVPSLDHPPGYYGAGGSPRAVNVLGPKSTHRAAARRCRPAPSASTIRAKARSR